MLNLYSYFRSSASYRVRIALNLKKLDYLIEPVQLAHGEQRTPDYLALNPAGLVPALADDDLLLTQSLAIIEYLDEVHPEPALLPGTAAERARIRAIALTVACEIHPLNNLSVLNYLKNTADLDDEARNAWYRHWVERGLAMVEQMLAGPHTGTFCHGDTPTLADCCLVPQIFNARRFACRLDHVPTVMRIHEHCMTLEAFQRAAPGAQPDAQ